MKRRACFLTLLGLGMILLALPDASHAGFVWQSNGHYYEAVYTPRGVTWQEAQDACVAAGGYLATITSAEENAFVFGLTRTYPDLWSLNGAGHGSGPWFGGHQPDGSSEPGGGWQWGVTGESFTYANWASGEPNNGLGGGAEDRTHFVRLFGLIGDTWNDAPGNGLMRGYILERDTPPPSWGTNQHTYRVVRQPRGITWQEAQNACAIAGGYLATLTSAEEDLHVFGLASADTSVWPVQPWGDGFGPWIGGMQPAGAAEPGSGWKWAVTAEPLSYTNWSPGNLDNAGGNENRIHFFQSQGQVGDHWNDIPEATLMAGYVLEIDPPVLAGCPPPAPGLISWWRAEGNAQDETALNHGVLKNGVSFDAGGKHGQAFLFDGADDAVEIPNSASMNPASITIAAWVKPSVIYANSEIITKVTSDQALPPYVSYQLNLRGDIGNRAEFYFVANDNVLRSAFGTSAIPIGAFSHIVGTYDGSEGRLYVDGVLQASGAGAGALRPTSFPATIGDASVRPTAVTPFNGLIDEVQLLNRALTPSEVQAAYLSGLDFDVDGDGYTSCTGDDDDGNVFIHPGARETCDGLDNDGDGTVDNGPVQCPAPGFCDTMIVSDFATDVPSPHAIAISPGGAYGPYMYVISGHHDIYRIDVDGNVSYFGSTRLDNRAYAVSLAFDETPDQRYGGYLYAFLDNTADPGPVSAGVDRVLPDGTSQVFFQGAVTSPPLIGGWNGVIDDVGRFGNEMFVTDFEFDDYGGPVTIYRLTPSGVPHALAGAYLRGNMGMDLDRHGNFGGDLLVTNTALPSGDPWWNGADNGIYRVAPTGAQTLVVPGSGLGPPIGVLVDTWGRFDGGLLVSYAGSSSVYRYDGSGALVGEVSIPGPTTPSLAQDRAGAFGLHVYATSQSDNKIVRITRGCPATVDVSEGGDEPASPQLTARPNPARASDFTIALRLGSGEVGHLEVFDVAGRSLARRELTGLGAGTHQVRMFEGTKLAPGVYLVRLTQGQRSTLARVVVIEQ